MTSAYIEKIKYEYEEKLTFTWLGAYWQRVDKLPSLNKVLGKNQQPKQPMTDNALFDVVKGLHKALGGKTVH
jgi:hypothetical protein